mmetsp:Transcript_37237/g.73107  ORF Transcript_37237/g.73107 Transcript_37237/m.73107 type:complete len:497 (-) Transcript_37237:102-1592(-)
MIRRILLNFIAAMLSIGPSFSDSSTLYVRHDHEISYHRMLKTKEEFRCELRSSRHEYHHSNGTCDEAKYMHRNFATIKKIGNVHRIQQLEMFDMYKGSVDDGPMRNKIKSSRSYSWGAPDKSFRSDSWGTTEKKPGSNRAKKIILKLAADAPEFVFELDDGPINVDNKNTEWYGQEVLINANGTIPGVATFIKSKTGAISGTVNSFLHGVVCSVFTRQNNHYVECVYHDSFPEELEGKHTKTSTRQKRRKRHLQENNSKRRHRHLKSDRKIDIMVVYTQKAMCADAGQDHDCDDSYKDTIEARIDLAVAQTNEAFKIAKTDTKLRLVKKMMTDYDEKPSWSKVLSDMERERLDKKIYKNRKKYDADLVHMIMAKGGFCGFGYIKTKKDDSFSLSNFKCSTSMYSFAHEVAHNLGCDHNKGNSAGPKSNKFAYGYQHQDSDGSFRTIMAYECESGTCPRVPIFSGKKAKYHGIQAGTKKRDNGRQIKDYSRKASNFM